MSDVITVEIKNVTEFRKTAEQFGIKVSDGPGRMPKRELLLKVREAEKAGTAKLIETDYFGVDSVLATVGSTIKRGPMVWTVHYHTLVDGKKSDPLKLDVTAEQIRKILPDANFQGRSLNGVVALVMVGLMEGAGIAELANYVVTNVVRAESTTEAVKDVPVVEDTPQVVSDADKPSETPEVTPVVEAVVAASAPVIEVKPAAKKTARRAKANA